jgi:hypothetical protein
MATASYDVPRDGRIGAWHHRWLPTVLAKRGLA